MSDNKKYYYLKLKDNFFESDSMILLETMDHGYQYSNILLKLYLRSLKDEGRLLLNGRIPYNATMIASITRHQEDTVEKALQLFQELGLIEVLDSGVIYMLDIQNYIGQSSTEADRKRNYRSRIEDEKGQAGQMSRQISDKNPPEIEIELEKEIKDKGVSKDTCRTDVQRITEVWNKNGVSEVKKISQGTNRHKMLKARIKEYGTDQIIEAITSIKSSPFLLGQNRNNWIITFDWFIKPNNFLKVLEGNYLDGKRNQNGLEDWGNE